MKLRVFRALWGVAGTVVTSSPPVAAPRPRLEPQLKTVH